MTSFTIANVMIILYRKHFFTDFYKKKYHFVATVVPN